MGATSQIPKVTVVVPAYNHAQFLVETLGSVVRQTFTDWECIVVNNFSTDNTVEVIDSFQDSRIRRLDFNNSGMASRSRNEGIKLARGEWVAFLDSDDFWDPTKLEECMALATPDVDAIAHGERVVQGGQVLREVYLSREADSTFENLLFKGNCLSSSGVMVRKTKLEDVNYWTTDVRKKMATDFDLWLKLAFKGVRFKHISKPLGEYRLHERNESHDVKAMMESALCVIDDHFQRRKKFGLQDQLKFQRARAFYMYVAARGHLWAGERSRAFEILLQAFKTYPLLGRIYYAGFLMLAGVRTK